MCYIMTQGWPLGTCTLYCNSHNAIKIEDKKILLMMWHDVWQGETLSSLLPALTLYRETKNFTVISQMLLPKITPTQLPPSPWRSASCETASPHNCTATQPSRYWWHSPIKRDVQHIISSLIGCQARYFVISFPGQLRHRSTCNL